MSEEERVTVRDEIRMTGLARSEARADLRS